MGYIKRKCDNCGKEYFVCRACEKSGSWKNVCCSRSCFRELIRKKTEKEKGEVVSSKEKAEETSSLVQETEKVSDKVVVDLNLDGDENEYQVVLEDKPKRKRRTSKKKSENG